MENILQTCLGLIYQYGYFTLLLIMLIEGSSIPFPGIFLLISLSSVLKPSTGSIIFWATGMSIIYSISSLLPYWIGRLIEKGLCFRLEKYIRKAQAFFQKYGEISIALTRPFSLGNYIGYVAGISNVHPVKYLVLTFSGIYPWCLCILYLGKIFGDAGEILAFLKANTHYTVLVTALITLVGYISYRFIFYFTRRSYPYDNKETPCS